MNFLPVFVYVPNREIGNERRMYYLSAGFRLRSQSGDWEREKCVLIFCLFSFEFIQTPRSQSPDWERSRIGLEKIEPVVEFIM